MDRVHRDLDRTAQTTTNRLLSLGWIILSMQLVAFIYLTWWVGPGVGNGADRGGAWAMGRQWPEGPAGLCGMGAWDGWGCW